MGKRGEEKRGVGPGETVEAVAEKNTGRRIDLIGDGFVINKPWDLKKCVEYPSDIITTA